MLPRRTNRTRPEPASPDRAVRAGWQRATIPADGDSERRTRTRSAPATVERAPGAGEGPSARTGRGSPGQASTDRAQPWPAARGPAHARPVRDRPRCCGPGGRDRRSGQGRRRSRIGGRRRDHADHRDGDAGPDRATATRRADPHRPGRGVHEPDDGRSGRHRAARRDRAGRRPPATVRRPRRSGPRAGQGDPGADDEPVHDPRRRAHEWHERLQRVARMARRRERAVGGGDLRPRRVGAADHDHVAQERHDDQPFVGRRQRQDAGPQQHRRSQHHGGHDRDEPGRGRWHVQRHRVPRGRAERHRRSTPRTRPATPVRRPSRFVAARAS